MHVHIKEKRLIKSCAHTQTQNKVLDGGSSFLSYPLFEGSTILELSECQTVSLECTAFLTDALPVRTIENSGLYIIL